MHRNLTLALLASVAMAGITSNAFAGSSDSYANANTQNTATVTTFTAAAPPVMETYAAPYVAPAPIAAEPVKDGYYDESRYGGNEQFGYQQQHACGGVVTGEKCLVILNDHMRRVRLDRPAGTILVGNPLIADVTVLGNDTIFVSARTIGSTNIIVLDKAGNEIVTYEVFVREPRIKRVVLNNAGVTQNYQCAPNCERALTQSDSAVPHSEVSGIISTDLGLDRTAIGLQTGPNPNEQSQQQQQQRQQQRGPIPGAGAGAGVSTATPGAATGLAGSVNDLGASLGPAMGLAETVSSLLGGGGGGGNAPGGSGPARTDAPPLPGSFDLN